MNLSERPITIIGAGIVGLANAWMAAKAGKRVRVFERSAMAEGASVRNFGMYWPVGQPAGELHTIAMRSGDYWRELAQEAEVWLHHCGSIHLAHRTDEWQVLNEFYDLSHSELLGYALLSPSAVCERSPGANPMGLLGGLWSPTEGCVNARLAIPRIAKYLATHFDVQFEFHTTVTQVADNEVTTADGRVFRFEKLLICSGADFETLFPELLRTSGLRRCKLQMLRTAPQPKLWKLGPHLASGLTLRHYRNFEICPTLPALKQRVQAETPELDRYGIHVMASQNDVGEVILGDSHEYDENLSPFDKTEIEELILKELQRLIRLPDWTISEHWHGVYAKHADLPAFMANPVPHVHIFTGTGGAGMTMSFGLAEKFWSEIL